MNQNGGSSCYVKRLNETRALDRDCLIASFKRSARQAVLLVTEHQRVGTFARTHRGNLPSVSRCRSYDMIGPTQMPQHAREVAPTVKLYVLQPSFGDAVARI